MNNLSKSIKTALQKAPREPFPENPLLMVAAHILTSIPVDVDELNSEQKNMLLRFIAITTYEMALQRKTSITPSFITHAAQVLVKNLLASNDDSLDTVEEKTMNNLYGIIQYNSSEIDEKKEIEAKKEDRTLEQSLIAAIIPQAKKQLEGGDGGSMIRAMMGVYNQIVEACKTKEIVCHLKNLTLGDVTGKNMPIKVVDALGYDPLGIKGRAIGLRARAYEAMLYEAGAQFDPHRYDLASLGWRGLRERFIEYGNQYGLYSMHSAQESLIGEGGSGTLLRVFMAALFSLKKEQSDKKFSAYFPNPAFRMVGDMAADAGFEVIETLTNPANGFFPDPIEVNTYLMKHPECRVFILIPIGNPNANFPAPNKINELLQVLQKHEMILVNDFAYLGTGDREKNKELALALSKYKRRVDCFSMSKIFGRTGLRCGCAVTPDEEIAKQFSPAAKHIQLGLSYPMQQEAMALWDFVSQEDRNVLNEYYRNQQIHLLSILKNNKKQFINPHLPIFDRAGLYLYVPLNEGFDVFDIMQETGYVGVPDAAFSNPALSPEGRYIRFALGVERITLQR